MKPMTIILAVCWVVPAALRTWRLARFFQIEEYMGGRFLRWWLSKREYRVPRQPATIMIGGLVISAALQIAGIENEIAHFLLWLAVCGLAALPEPVREVKKAFNRTQRAVRILASAFVLLTWVIVGYGAITPGEIPMSQALSSVAIVGFLLFLLAPIVLIAANGLMFPVETFLRNQFRRRAQARLRAADPTVIGITGSYGKTSTKHFLAHLLGGRYKVYPTPKSYNTEMGICLAINNDLDPNYGYEYFIAEMGAYVPGEIARIAELTHPTISIVTAVGPMHLERFKTLENVVTAKYEIVENLPPDGLCIFNGDNPYVLEMAGRGYPRNRVIVSADDLPEANIVAENISQTLDGLAFDVLVRESGERHAFKTSLLGTHNVTNILLATAVGLHAGLSLAELGMRTATLEAGEHRLNRKVLPNGVIVLDDAYSANPVGAANALDVLKIHAPGRRIVITPGMVELGAVEDEENFRLGQHLTTTATDIVLVGAEQTRPLQRGISEMEFDRDRLLVVETFEEARQWFQESVKAGDAVLFLNDLPDTYL